MKSISKYIKMKIIKIKYCFILLILSSIGINAQINTANKAVRAKIDNYLNKSVSSGFAGAVLVAKKGEIIFNKAYGFANKEEHILNTTETIYDIGSVTKQFTATAILKLVQLNKLKLNDPLKTFFHDLPKDKKNLTIHQLLTHSAGLIDVIGEGDFDHMPRAVFFKELFDTALINEPGTKHEYSNSGYSILARIIELVSGEDYESFLNTHLFAPAGMKETGYLIPDWNPELYAIGYRENVINIGSMAARYRKEGQISWVLKGNGGFNSTLEDMYKWSIALKTNKVISKELTKILTTPYILEYEDGTSHYAYGWAIFKTDRQTTRITHNGSNGVFFHDYIWLPEEDLVIIYFTNAFTQQIMDVAWDIEKMIFDKDYKPRAIKVDISTEILKYALDYKDDIKGMSIQMKAEFGKKIRNPYYLNHLGYIFVREENLEKAIAVFELNVELFPEEANLWDSLGEAYLLKGDNKKALKYYQRAVKMDPNMESAKAAIEKLNTAINKKE